MSESQRRESSDFSIERILSKDGSTAVASSSSSAVSCKVKETLLVSEQFLHQAVTLRSPSKFIQHKLDWLRSFRNLAPSATDNQTEKLNFEDDNSIEPVEDSNSRLFNNEELSWLRCTRYHPPKLPRKSCNGRNIKRKPGSHPRIPFTKNQLEILEDKYKNNAYLTRKDVLHLSEILQLPQTRIKIWFQNRRARERRESQVLKQKEKSAV